MGELYGEYDESGVDWKDGIASKIMRDYARMGPEF
eukprot:CAMPEP_0168316106 /NCGR_PEP_ID=MMETSP0210-20121227/14323_1 /TAXON_ID=40633 /ORGANISM="Condylostoma magnum, Strain COL2" /LENGTH=34 /DNA_ID= /DNA_START= /DNA_END= /DNA_ORIENTATION=